MAIPIPFRQTENRTLESCFPDFMAGQGIFDYLQQFPWNLNASASIALNMEYYLNRSGQKLASPLVSRMVNDETSALDTTTIASLASIIKSRFTHKWNQYWKLYSDLSTLNLLQNINMTTETLYASGTSKSGSDTVNYSGSESDTIYLDETRTESYDALNPRRTSRTITGTYTDSTNTNSTRTGTEETVESFPETLRTSKTTTGGYVDSDTTSSTRTGSQKVTEKGDTAISTFGFNSSSPVPSSRSGPADSSTGVTSETTFGQEGLKDTRSGAITRSYGLPSSQESGLQETTTQSGQRKMATTFGQDGLRDSLSSGTTRTYNNYNESVTESGTKTSTTSYGQDGRTSTHDFTDRLDEHVYSINNSHTGKDTVTEVGNRYRNDELTQQYIALFQNSELFDFFEIVYSDIDSVLTCPVFVY